MQKGRYWEELPRNQVTCTLCPHHCLIGEGKTGTCKVRRNVSGELFTENYGIISSSGFDPIEKKPLYHFYPGKVIFSIGSYGCNLRCKFCQNWQISQEFQNQLNTRQRYAPEELISTALTKKTNIGVAYTYNEPVVWFEYMVDIAHHAKNKGLKNVMVSNGYISPEPLNELIEIMDAFNVDLKAFTEEFYKYQTFSRLEPVKNTLKTIRKSGRHLEITNLVVTSQNDNLNDFHNMVKWIEGELGRETVLHISRYFPTYKMSVVPTPAETLQDFYELALQHLDYVYLGNLATGNGQGTRCPKCHTGVIDRSRYDVWINGLDKAGNCRKCGHPIIDHI